MTADLIRRLLAYTRWADGKLLAAASGLDAERLSSLNDALLHLLGIYVWWEGLWSGREWIPPTAATYDGMCEAFASIHGTLERHFARAASKDLAVSKAWWEPWGETATLQLVDTVAQIVLHGVQHRSEIAVLLTAAGCSPGDIDYLNYALRKDEDA